MLSHIPRSSDQNFEVLLIDGHHLGEIIEVELVQLDHHLSLSTLHDLQHVLLLQSGLRSALPSR